MLKFLKSFSVPAARRKLSKYLTVEWTHKKVQFHSRFPNQDYINHEFQWDQIERVCLEVTSHDYSNELYIFTNKQIEAYVIPLDAKNGKDFMQYLIVKKFFDDDYFDSKKYSKTGQYWWPESQTA